MGSDGSRPGQTDKNQSNHTRVAANYLPTTLDGLHLDADVCRVKVVGLKYSTFGSVSPVSKHP